MWCKQMGGGAKEEVVCCGADGATLRLKEKIET